MKDDDLYHVCDGSYQYWLEHYTPDEAIDMALGCNTDVWVEMPARDNGWHNRVADKYGPDWLLGNEFKYKKSCARTFWVVPHQFLVDLKSRNQPGIAGNNNRSENMNDYTNTVQGQLDERDRANKEIEKQQLKITRDITSKIGDLAVIHTDDAGVLDRFALGTSLDKTLLPFGFISVDQVDDGD